MAEVKIRIRVKRGTKAEWETINPVLGLGEIGWVTDEGFWVCGNAIDNYSTIIAGDGSNIWWSKKEVEDYVASQIVGGNVLTAIPFNTNHISAYGSPYNVGELVYYSGKVYRCIATNDSILPTNASYWLELGTGYPLAESPIDWNATSGNNQIINKPTIVESVNEDGSGVVKVDNTDPLNPIIQFAGVEVDGITITGDGTSGNPLTATVGSGFVESVSDDAGGNVKVDNTDPINPIVQFLGVSTDGVTMGGDGTAINPLYSLGADAFTVKASATDGSPSELINKIACTLDSSITIANIAPSGYEYVDVSVNWSPRVVFECKNTGGTTINYGDPIYIMGMVGATNVIEVGKADASDPTKMPSTGLAWNTMATNGLGGVVVSGFFGQFTTDPIDGVTPTPNQTLYVKAGGGLTTVKPTGTNLIQNIGKVGKVSGGSSGSIMVSSIMRTNDIPNIADTKIWIGNASGVPTAQSLSGDVTMANTGAVTIANDSVTYAKIQNVSSTKKLLGRVSTGAGDVEEVDLSSDGTLGGAGSSGSVVASQSAVKNYVDVGLGTKQNTLTNPVTGTGTNNELTYFNATGSTVASLSTATYPNLTELSYVKGVTSAVQTQIGSKQDTLVSGTNIKTVNGITLLGSGDLDIHGYTLTVQALTSSPADGATIYFGNLPKAPTTTANTSKIYIRKAGTIKHAEIYCFSGTAGTAENWSLYIRKNNTTDTLIATVGSATSERVFSNTALSIAVAVNDYIEIKAINPTWATNPLTTIFGGYIYIE